MIIDTHTHFYDPERPEGVPWPNPEDKLLYRRVLPEHYKALARPEGVTGTVVVEASRWVEDNQWILDLAADEPFIVGLVGHLDIGTPQFEQHIEHYAANSLFRGIRLGGGAVKQAVRDGDFSDLERLAAKDLELDVLLNADGLAGVAEIARRIPSLRIVINHVAHVRIDGNAPDAVWVEAIKGVAAHENVFMKVSGLVENTRQTPAPKHLDYYRPTLDTLWDAFGENRLIYGSNWPVSERFADYAAVQRIVFAYFNEKGSVAADKYFWKNAKVAYKWVTRER